MQYEFEKPEYPPPESIKRWERRVDRRKRKKLHDRAVRHINKEGQQYAGLTSIILKLSGLIIFLMLMYAICQRVS